MGTSQDYRVAVEEGATLVRVGSVLVCGRVTFAGHGLRGRLEPHPRLLRHRRGGETGTRTAMLTNEELERAYVSGRTCAGCAAPPRRDEYDEWTDPSDAPRRRASSGPRDPRRGSTARSRAARVGSIRPRPPRPPAQLQRRPADRRQVQGGDPGHPQPPERRPGAVQAPDRLRERAHLRAQRRDAAGRGQGVPAHAAQRRGVSRGARPAARARRLLQPGVASGRAARVGTGGFCESGLDGRLRSARGRGLRDQNFVWRLRRRLQAW